MIAANRRSATLAVLATVCLVLTAATSATAAPTTATDGPTTLKVRGTQTLVEGNKYRSDGGLLGDFWILTYVPTYESDSLAIGTGTERFVGCVDVNRNNKCGAREPSGELRFDYIQWVTFDPSTGALIEGNCVHPITGGSGSFKGARGIVTMHDVPANGGVRTTYRGTVVLNAVPSDPAPATSAAHAQTAAVPQTREGRC
jgi:hypothetical protein